MIVHLVSGFILDVTSIKGLFYYLDREGGFLQNGLNLFIG